MCLEFVSIAVTREDILTRLSIPSWMWDTIRDSWKKNDPALMGRFDLVYNEDGRLSMLEYNPEVTGIIYETGFNPNGWGADTITI